MSAERGPALQRGPGGMGARSAEYPGAGPRPGLRSALSSLENPQYRWLYVSNISFFLAMGSQQIVRAWIAFELTGRELALGSVSFAVAIGMFVLGPVGGVIADRRERRNLIVAGQLAVVLTELTILALLVTGWIRFWHLLAAATVMGCVFPFVMPARQAIVMNIVGRSGLPNAMALSMAGMNATRILGPAAAGFLIHELGVELTYGLGFGLYVVALLCLLRLHRSRPDARAREVSVARNVADGLAYMGRNRLVLVLLFFGLVPMFLAMPFQTLLVVFAKEIWGVGSQGFGVLHAVSGVGGLLGSIWVALRSESPKRLGAMMISMLGFGGFLVLFAQSPWFIPALGCVLIASAFSSVYGTLNNTVIQLVIPDHVRGRVSSFLMMSFSLPMLGTLPLSALAEVYGVAWAVTAAAALAMTIALLFYLGSSELRSMDATVARGLEE